MATATDAELETYAEYDQGVPITLNVEVLQPQPHGGNRRRFKPNCTRRWTFVSARSASMKAQMIAATGTPLALNVAAMTTTHSLRSTIPHATSVMMKRSQLLQERPSVTGSWSGVNRGQMKATAST